MRRKKKLIVWSALLAYLLIAAGDVEGTVFYFEPDGPVRGELALDWIFSEDLPDRLEHASQLSEDLTLAYFVLVYSSPSQDIPHPTNSKADHPPVGFTQGPPPQLVQLAAAFGTKESRSAEVANRKIPPTSISSINSALSFLRSTVLRV